MTTDRTRNGAVLPPRADIALLTLRLRAAIHEAEQAEQAGQAESTGQAEAVKDVEVACEALRSRLRPLLDRKRQQLDAELVAAHGEAGASIDAARQAAAVLATQSTRPGALPTALLEPPSGLPVVPQFAVQELITTVAAVVVVDDPVIDDPVIDIELMGRPEPIAVEPEPEELVVVQARGDETGCFVRVIAQLEPLAPEPLAPEPLAPEPLAPEPLLAAMASVDPHGLWRKTVAVEAAATMDGMPASLAVNVVIDAEAFARVFATVIASLVDERMGPASPTPTSWPTYIPMPMPMQLPAPAPAPQGFWAAARHTDVILLGITGLILMGVLAAWLA